MFDAKRCSPSRFGRTFARAFTLVELLVVIGMLAILLAILLPAISHARAEADCVVCLSNLRQMAIAAQEYINENDGSYPIAYYYGGDSTATYTYCWDLTTVSYASGYTQVVPGLLWEGSTIEKIQQCPSFDGAANWMIDPYTGYNYNTSYIGHGEYESIPAPAKASSIQNPSGTALFGDGQWAGGADKFMRAPWPNPGDASFSGRWSGTQGYRHLGKTNVVFCDGHGESLSACYTSNADGAANVALGTGFLSGDNSMYGE